MNGARKLSGSQLPTPTQAEKSNPGCSLTSTLGQAMSVTASSRKQGRISAHSSFLDEAEMVSILTVSS
ncbi:hypothetical protein QC761_0062270 [Podospora bellae-mahoneyi]|uniref:Uncharacterized protein n=1 Tax=Podospora bellae-mahoneyi TaxID=2093777 RepID=A0ABR0FHV3_9PEZI|nr:hypothetical protein QC761_0062270 [Podospora bellae-mahoneyi]